MHSTTSLIVIVVLLILVLIVAWFIKTQNRLVSANEICGNALSALAQLTKSYTGNEEIIVI